MSCGLIVALDTPSIDEARRLVATLGEKVFFYKIGLRLLVMRGIHPFIDELVEARKRVFLDYKVHDIPATVRDTVANVAARGIDLITVHGDDPEIVAAAVEGAKGSYTQILAVTVLTSQDNAAMLRMGWSLPISYTVEMRARFAQSAGAHGVIASPQEIEMLRACMDPKFLIVTPGIRMPGAAHDDQKRVADPAEAARLGADFIVVGRPIITAENPAEAARQICDALGNTRLPVA